MKKYILILVAFSVSAFFSSARAQQNRQQTLDELFQKNGEIYFSFAIFDRNEIPVLTRVISIDNVKGKEVFAYANRKEFSNFLDLGYTYTLLPHPGSLLKESELNMGGKQEKPHSGTTWNFYPTYDQYVAYMQAFANDHPNICRLDTFGTTTQGRLLLAVKLSDSVNVKRAKPEFLYTSSIHGDEVTGYILMMHLIDSLVSNYGSVTRVTNLLNNFQIYINPLANPDGTYHGGNSTVNGAQRYNANNIDLNRNFADPAAGPHPDGNPWQAETKAFMHLDTIHHFVMSANFHGGSEVVNYPWDTWSKLHADNNWMDFTSREYADTVHLHAPAGYMTDLDNGVTNGYAWYTITGGRQDYTTYFHYGREVTIEISAIKLLPAGQLLNYWGYNKRSFLNYIEESSYGINGQVTDTATGKPVKAKVTVVGHDFDNSFEYSDATTGWYFRPIEAGNFWTLSFSCLGYYTKTISNVQTVNHAATRLNVALVPIGFGIPETKKSVVFVYPNPSRGDVHILLPETGTSYKYTVFDLSGRILKSGNLDRAGDVTLFPLDMTSLSKGLYPVKLEGNGSVYENKVVIQ